MFRGTGTTSSVTHAAGSPRAGVSLEPKALVVLVKMKASTPAATASSRRIRVPVTLTSTKSRPAWVATCGLCRVAAWSTARTPRMPCLTSSRSQMEPTQSVKGDGLRSRPRASRCSARKVRMSASPRWPALPVTRIMSTAARLHRSLHRIARRAERQGDLVQDGGIVDGGGHGVLHAVGDPLHGAAEDLARARLGQPLHHDGELEGGHGPDPLAHALHEIMTELVVGALHARLGHHEADGHLALESVGHAHYRALRHVGMTGQHFFHGARGEPVASDIDDVVDATHDVEIAVLVLEARVAGQIVAGMALEVGTLVPRVVVPERRETAGRHGQPDGDGADLPRGDLLVRFVEHAHVVARHGLGR